MEDGEWTNLERDAGTAYFCNPCANTVYCNVTKKTIEDEVGSGSTRTIHAEDGQAGLDELDKFEDSSYESEAFFRLAMKLVFLCG